MMKRPFLLALGMSGSVVAGQPMGCLIEPQQVAEVGTPVIGVVESLPVERGDRVSKGQVIAVLRADVERAAVKLAQSRAQAEADEQAARASLSFARQKLERAEDLAARKFISEQDLDQIRTEYEVAEKRLAQAGEQKLIAQRELALALAQLRQRSIRSPLSGFVAERYISVGERVEDQPLFKVVKADPLKVQVLVPAALYGRINVGATARVQPQLPNAAAVNAKITLVDKLIHAPSNTFRVQLELPNPGLSLPAGLRCMADFGLDAGGNQQASTTFKPTQPASQKNLPKASTAAIHKQS